MTRFACVVFCTCALFQHVASVEETSETYSCVRGPQNLKSDRASRAKACEQSWTIERNPIGRYLNGSVECHTPCTEVTPGGIVVSECVNVTLAVFCSEDYMTEYRIHFYGMDQTLTQDAKDRARYGVFASLALLLLVVIMGLLHCKFHRHGS